MVNDVEKNSLEALKQFTDARIGLGRSGISIPTKEHLKFQLAHARARDAVHTPLNTIELGKKLHALASLHPMLNQRRPIVLKTKAGNRYEYLQRPDLGRQLCEQSMSELQNEKSPDDKPYDLGIVVADGLSATAIVANVVPFLESLASLIKEANTPRSLSPICMVEHARVAVGDDIGSTMKCRAILILIGERPGLSSPDSLGMYLTWAPAPGLKDDRRNCISNIRKAGLGYEEAARKTLYLLHEAKKLNTSGVAIKDRQDTRVIDASDSNTNFLVTQSPSHFSHNP